MVGYQIAVASTDGSFIDAHFGSCETFYIYRVAEDGTSTLVEERRYDAAAEDTTSAGDAPQECGCGCRGQVHGKAAMLSDCRFLLCAAAGPGAVRKLEAAGVTVFDVSLPVAEALEKIINFYRER